MTSRASGTFHFAGLPQALTTTSVRVQPGQIGCTR
jgi:hypothetical protein